MLRGSPGGNPSPSGCAVRLTPRSFAPIGKPPTWATAPNTTSEPRFDPMQGTVEHGKWVECLAEAGVAI